MSELNIVSSHIEWVILLPKDKPIVYFEYKVIPLSIGSESMRLMRNLNDQTLMSAINCKTIREHNLLVKIVFLLEI
jgi:hypothetical protein